MAGYTGFLTTLYRWNEVKDLALKGVSVDYVAQD